MTRRGLPPNRQPVATYFRYDPPRDVYEYGFDKDGPIADRTSASEFLLPWAALDAHAARSVSGRPCELVVAGEYRLEGRRWPDLAVNPAFMASAGYVRDGRKWRVAGEKS